MTRAKLDDPERPADHIDDAILNQIGFAGIPPTTQEIVKEHCLPWIYARKRLTWAERNEYIISFKEKNLVRWILTDVGKVYTNLVPKEK